MAVSQSLTLTQSSQSVADNTSRVRIVWKSTQTGASYNGYTRTAYYYVSINGGAETRYSVSYTLPQNATRTIVDTTITVKHTAAGAGSVRVRTYMDTDISAGVVEQSKTLNLTTIPRATTPTLSASSVDMGDSVTISLPRAAGSFTHDLAYKFGSDSSYRAITTGAGTSYNWTVPDRASDIPNATSGTITLRVITKSGSTTIGTKTKTLTAKVPAEVVPTISAVAVAEGVSSVKDLVGAFVQSKSKAAVTITAAGAKGSTIEEYTATFAGKTYPGRTWTSETLATSGTLTVKARVKDSRGRWSAYKSVDIIVLPYYTPRISKLTAYRCDANGNAQDDGLYMFLSTSYSVAPLNNKNTAAAKVQYKQSTATSYVSTAIWTSSALSAAVNSKLNSPTFSTDYTFDIRMTVTDVFGASSTYDAVLPSAAVILDIRANGLGIAFGKTSEQDGIEFGWDIVDRVKSTGSMAGRLRTHDGVLIQWGAVNITPTAADTPTTAVVTFPLAYKSTPAVFVESVSGVPQQVSTSIQRAAELVGDNKKAVGITLTRTGTTSTGLYWLAIGEGE